MASLGGDRDKLLRAFLSQSKKRRKPGMVSSQKPTVTPFRPRKQGTVASYRPSKRAKY